MRILVAEDSRKHLQDALAALSGIKGLEIVTARNSSEASRLISVYDHETKAYETKVDGVITDIYMPLTSDSYWAHDECPCGFNVAADAIKAGIPFVFCTSGYHHGAKFEWIQHFCSAMKWPGMVDSGSDYYQDAETKDWARAFEKLKKLIEKSE